MLSFNNKWAVFAVPKGVLKRVNMNFFIYFIKETEHSLCGLNLSINWYFSINLSIFIPPFPEGTKITLGLSPSLPITNQKILNKEGENLPPKRDLKQLV